MHKFKFCFLILIILVPKFIFAQENQLKQNQYNIGVIASLTGPMSIYGLHMKRGAELALENLPHETREKINLIFEDDQSSTKESLSAYNKLRSQNQVKAVLSFGSASGNVLGPVAELDKIIEIAVGASDKNITKDKQYVFTHWVCPETEAKRMVQEVNNRKYQKLGIIKEEHDGLNALRQNFVDELEKANLKSTLSIDQSFLPGTTDFKTAILQLKNEKVDGTALFLFPNSVAIFAKQARSLGYNADLFGPDTFEDKSLIKASNNALVGSWLINGDIGSEKFTEEFSNKFNETPGPTACNAYDAIMLISNGVTAFNDDNQKIAQNLSQIKNYHGACGEYSSTGDNRFSLPTVVKKVTESGFELIP